MPRRQGSDLDKDLAAFLEYAQGERLAKLKAVGSNKEISKAEYSAQVPDEIVRILSYVSMGPAYRRLLGRVKSPEKKEMLERARGIAEGELRKLAEHPLTLERLMADLEEDMVEEDLATSVHVIRSLSCLPQWTDGPSGLVPTLRMRLFGKKGNVLLDSLVDWDDAAFICRGLLQAVADQMDSSVRLSKEGFLDLTVIEQFPSRIAHAKKELARIEQMMKTFGLSELRGEPDRK